MSILDNIVSAIADDQRPDDPGPPLTLADARALLPTIKTALVAQLTARGITLVDVSTDATGVTVTIARNGNQLAVPIGRGWRNQGHLTSYPTHFLRDCVLQALNPDTNGGDTAAAVKA